MRCEALRACAPLGVWTQLLQKLQWLLRMWAERWARGQGAARVCAVGVGVGVAGGARTWLHEDPVHPVTAPPV